MGRAVRWAVLVFLLVAVLLVWTWALRTEPRLRIWFLDVGQGDAIVIQTPSGHVLLVDTGGRTAEDDMGRRVVMPFLRAKGINDIDAVVLTHPDEDHIAGAATILDRFPVDRLLISGISSANSTYNRIFHLAEQRHVVTAMLTRGQQIQFRDGVSAEVLNPSPTDSVSHNNGSIVLRVQYGSTSVILTGDAEALAEDEISRLCGDVHADVLKLGHHGSHTSTTPQFLDSVKPQAVVISVGRRNQFGHPHPDVLNRLSERHIRTFRTDRDGEVALVSDGHTLRINAMVHVYNR
jgi:competence protein ComEC